ncbi:MAG: hypothetical protein ACFFD2_26870, partial [Promethearchaeota archaeon]
AILILGKFGWKLARHKINGTRLDMDFDYVGENDPSIFEPINLINFPGFINQQFQKLCVIALDEYYDLRNTLYELSPEKYKAVFRTQGKKLANAIKFLAKNDVKKMWTIANMVLPQALKESGRDPKDIDVIFESGKVRIIFKKTDIIELEQFRASFTGIVEGFGYLDIKSRIIENMVIIEFVRPDEINSNEAKPGEAEPNRIESDEKRLAQDTIE